VTSPSIEVLIVRTTLHYLLLSVPQAAAIWLFMLFVSLTAAVALAVPGRRRAAHPGGEYPDDEPRGGHEPRGGGRARDGRARDGRGARVQEPTVDPLHRIRDGLRSWGAAVNTVDDRAASTRYAEEVAVAAERASVTAGRARAAWEKAHAAVEQTWQAFDAADRAARRASQAVAFPSPYPSISASDYADRERFLHRAAVAACRRHQLSIQELSDALAHRHGWDPRLHPVHQEALLRRVIRNELFAAYCAATRAERQAWHVSGVASAAMCSLRAEARSAALQAGTVRVAAEQAWWAEQWTPSQVRVAQTVPAPAPARVAPTVVRLPAATVPMTAVPVGPPRLDADATQPLRLIRRFDDEATQPLRTIGQFGDEATQPLRVPAQTRSGTRPTPPRPAQRRPAPAAAEVDPARPVLRPAIAQPQLASR
jgi:hypothetical protein